MISSYIYVHICVYVHMCCIYTYIYNIYGMYSMWILIDLHAVVQFSQQRLLKTVSFSNFVFLTSLSKINSP